MRELGWEERRDDGWPESAPQLYYTYHNFDRCCCCPFGQNALLNHFCSSFPFAFQFFTPLSLTTHSLLLPFLAAIPIAWPFLNQRVPDLFFFFLFHLTPNCAHAAASRDSLFPASSLSARYLSLALLLPFHYSSFSNSTDTHILTNTSPSKFTYRMLISSPTTPAEGHRQQQQNRSPSPGSNIHTHFPAPYRNHHNSTLMVSSISSSGDGSGMSGSTYPTGSSSLETTAALHYNNNHHHVHYHLSNSSSNNSSPSSSSSSSTRRFNYRQQQLQQQQDDPAADSGAITVDEYREILSAEVWIEIPKLREYARHGIPREVRGVRTFSCLFVGCLQFCFGFYSLGLKRSLCVISIPPPHH